MVQHKKYVYGTPNAVLHTHTTLNPNAVLHKNTPLHTMPYYIIVTVHSQMHLMADAQGSKNTDTCQSHGKTVRKPVAILTFHAEATVLHWTRTCNLRNKHRYL